MALTTLGWLGLQNLWLLGTLAAQRRGARALVLQAAARGLLLLGLPLLLHVLLLRLHFAHLPRSGNGDAYMSPEFQATLEGSRYAESVPFEGRPSFWAQARIRRACGVRAACVRACVRRACVRHACGTRAVCIMHAAATAAPPPPVRSCSSMRSHSSGTIATWPFSSLAARTPSTRPGATRVAPQAAGPRLPTRPQTQNQTQPRTQTQPLAQSQTEPGPGPRLRSRPGPRHGHRPQPEPEPQPGTRGRWRRGASTLTW